MLIRLLQVSWGVLLLFSASAHGKIYDMEQYFPLEIGSYWMYEGISTVFNTGPGGAKTNFASTVTTAQQGLIFNGVQTTLLDDDERMLLGQLGRNKWYFARYSGETRLYSSSQGDSSCIYDAPVIFLPSLATEGETFTNSANMTCDGILIEVDRTAKVTGVEKVNVPAGTFDALKIIETITFTAPDLPSPNTQQELHFSWFAKDIGEVKRQWENYYTTGTLAHRSELALAASSFIEEDNEQKDDGCSEECATGNPINYGTGNKFQAETDYVGVGAFPLRLRRFYNSRVSSPTLLGSNWRHNYDSRITPILGVTPARVVVSRTDGKVYTFTRQNSGAWTPDADVTNKLEAGATDTEGNVTAWYYTTSRHDVETYDQAGRLIETKNRAGLVHTLSYMPNSPILSTVTDSFGRKLTFNYHPLTGRLANVVDPAGGTIGFSFDGNHNITQVTYQDGKVRTYGYNESAYTGGANLPWALTSITDENGAIYAMWYYDETGRAISSEHAGGAEKVQIIYHADGTRTITDSLNKSRIVSVQKILSVSKTASLSEPCSTCRDGATAIKTHDVNGNVASRTDFNGNKTAYEYDLARNLETKRIEVVDTPQVRTISTQWHPTHRLPTKIAEPKRITTNTYDDSGNLLTKTIQATSDATGALGMSATAIGTARIWTYTYNTMGQILTATGPRTDIEDKTSYTYDANGNLATITNAAGHVTTLSDYDAHGRVGRIVDPNGLTTDMTYHPRGWLTSRTISGSGITETTSYEYDGVGQLKSVTLPTGSTIAYTYDDAHRLTAIADSLGNSIAYTLDAMGNRIHEAVKDPNGVLARQTSRVYDALNRLQQITGGVQ